MKQLNSCHLCPRACHINRNQGKIGFCKAGKNLKIARASLHVWEEPCLSNLSGSGTIFFSYCTLKCIFCQNYDISTNNYGIEVSIEKFCDICLRLQRQNACNINLVTPTHFVPQIIAGIKLAKEKGLTIPVVYNSSGYETKETLKQLEGIVDIYLPDFKYFNDHLANQFSHTHEYRKYAMESLQEMVRQQPICQIENGIMKKGVIVRHLLLPHHLNDAKKIVCYLYQTFHNQIYISMMSQYTPLRHIKEYPELNERVTTTEYEKWIQYALDLGIENAFIQEGNSADESFIPKFDGKGVL